MYKFVENYLKKPKFLLLIVTALFIVSFLDSYLCSLLNRFLNKINPANGLLCNDVLAKYEEIITFSIILIITFFIFKLLGNKNFKIISACIGLLSAVIINTLNFIIVKEVDYWQFISDLFSISVLIFTWIILSESTLKIVRILSLGYFAYLLIQSIIEIFVMIIYNEIDLIFVISSVLNVFIFSIIFEIILIILNLIFRIKSFKISE